MNTTNFSEVLQKREQLLNSKAVWQELYDHLAKFIDSDAAPAKMGIRTEAVGLVVPQSIVEEIRDHIAGTIDDVKQEIDDIDQLKVTHGEQPEADRKEDAEKEGDGEETSC